MTQDSVDPRQKEDNYYFTQDVKLASFFKQGNADIIFTFILTTRSYIPALTKSYPKVVKYEL